MSKKQEINILFNKELKILIGSIVIIFLIVAGFIFYNQKNKSEQIEVNKTESSQLIRSNSHRTGPDDAKVKIVEFYDPECEACAAFYPYVKNILKKYPNDVQLIVRYALYHSNSLLAAKASEAASIQGKFWEYQEILFLKQNEWSHNSYPADKFFTKYAKELLLDVEKFTNDMNDLNRVAIINQDIADGKALGVSGTPTFFINGVSLTKFSPDGLEESVINELRK